MYNFIKNIFVIYNRTKLKMPQYHTIHDQYEYYYNYHNTYKNVTKFIIEYKVTSGLFFVMLVIYAIFTTDSKYERLVLQYDTIPREIIAQFVHIKLSHLITNLLTFLSFRNIEKNEGSKIYFYKIIYFIMMNACLIESLNRFYDTDFAFGYSGVLFGFITLYPEGNFFGYQCDKNYYPFMVLLAMQILFENAFFIGHLIGIISAYIYIGVRDIRDR